MATTSRGTLYDSFNIASHIDAPDDSSRKNSGRYPKVASKEQEVFKDYFWNWVSCFGNFYFCI